MSYTDTSALFPNTLETALRVARGCYQRNIIRGVEALSGSTLRGRAARYRGRYKGSAANLLARLRTAGFHVTERRESHGKRVLVIALRPVAGCGIHAATNPPNAKGAC